MKHFFKLSVFVFAVTLSLTFNSQVQAQSEPVIPHPGGTLVVANGTIYQISDDRFSRMSIDSVEKFYSHRFNFANVLPANQADLALENKGIIPWGDGVLFEDKGAIYQITSQKKYGFSTEKVFLDLGFNFASAIPAKIAELPYGGDIDTALTTHKNGTFVHHKGVAWKITDGKKQAIGTPSILRSYGLDFKDLIAATEDDIDMPNGEDLPFKPGSIVNDQGTVWVITKTGKLSFDSADCFLKFSFAFNKIFTGSAADKKNIGSACSVPKDPNDLTYEKKTVNVSGTNFTVYLLTAKADKVEFITDTAADKDCTVNCPAASVKSFVEANGGRAGLHGSYFCSTGSGCNLNSFGWKIYDSKLGKLINQNSGFAENEPFIAQLEDKSLKFYDQWSQFDVKTKIIAGLNHQPILVKNGQFAVNYNKLDEKQVNFRSSRGAIGFKGSTIYAMVGLNMTIPDSARVMAAIGADYALALDGGGTSALYFDGEYKIGPGRNTPNAIVFK